MASKVRIPIEVQIENLQDIPKLEDELKKFGSIAQSATEAAKKYSQEDQIKWAQYQKAVTTALKGATAAQNDYINNLKKMFDVSSKMFERTEDGGMGTPKITNEASYQKEINTAIQQYAVLLKETAATSEEAKQKINQFWQAFAGKQDILGQISGEMGRVEDGIKMLTDRLLEMASAGQTDGAEVGKLLAKLDEYDQQLKKLQNTQQRSAYNDFMKHLKQTEAYLKDTGRELEALQTKYRTLDAQIKKNINNGEVKYNKQLIASLKETQQAIDELNASKASSAGGFNLQQVEAVSNTLELMGEHTDAARYKMSQLKGQLMELAASGKENTEEFSKLLDVYKQMKTTSSWVRSWAQSFGRLITYVLKYRIALSLVRDTWRFITQTIKESTQAAASAEQVYNKLETVFSNYNAAIKESISLSRQLGTAVSTSASAMSTIGDILQGQGMGRNQSLQYSAQWSQALADLIAFKDLNTTLDEFASTFMAGAAGNVRNFRSFGSIVKETAVQARLLSDGLADLTGEELELAKMVTRATLALEQQENSAGAVAREWDTVLSVNRRLSESWKEWKENLGTVINQGLHPFKKALAEILESANNVKRIRDALKNETRLKSDAFDLSNKSDYGLMADAFSTKTHINWGATAFGSTNNASIEYPANSIDELVRKLYSLRATYQDLEQYFDQSGQPGLLDWLHNNFDPDEVAAAMKKFEIYADAPEKFATAWNDAADAMERANDNLNTITGLMNGFQTVGDYAAGNDFTDKNSVAHIIGLTSIGMEGNEEAALEGMVELYSNLQKAIADTTNQQDELNKTLRAMETEFKNKFGTSANLKSFSRTTDAYGNPLTEEDIKTAKEMIAQIDLVRSAISDSTVAVEGFKKNLSEVSPIIAQLYSKSLIQTVAAISDEYDAQIKDLQLETDLKARYVGASDKELSILAEQQKALDALDSKYNEQYAVISLLEDNEQALADLAQAREDSEHNILAYFNERIRRQKQSDAEEAEEKRLATVKETLEAASELDDEALKTLATLKLETGLRESNKGMSEDELNLLIEREKAVGDIEEKYDELKDTLLKNNATQEELDQLDNDREAAIQAQNDLYEYQLELLKEEQELLRQNKIDTALATGESINSDMVDKWMDEAIRKPSFLAQAGGNQDIANAYYENYNAVKKLNEEFDVQRKILDDNKATQEEIDQLEANRTSALAWQETLLKKQIKDIEDEAEARRKAYMTNTALKAAPSSVVEIINNAKSGFEQGGIWGAILNVAVGILNKFGVLDELNEAVDDALEHIVKPLMPMVSSITSLVNTIIGPILEEIETPIKIIATVITGIAGAIEGFVYTVNWLWDNIKTALLWIPKQIYNLFHPFHQAEANTWRSMEDLTEGLGEIADKTSQNIYKIWHNQEEEKNALDDSYIKAVQDMIEGGILTDIEGMGLITSHVGNGAWSNTLAPKDSAGNYLPNYATGSYSNSTYNFTINGTNLSTDELIQAMLRYYYTIQQTGGNAGMSYIGGM